MIEELSPVGEPPPVEELPPIEEVPEPEPEPVPVPKRRGRPPGAKNKPKAVREEPPSPKKEPPKKEPPKKVSHKKEARRVESDEEQSDSEGDVMTAVNFFSSHLGNLQRQTLEAKRDSWRNLFR